MGVFFYFSAYNTAVTSGWAGKALGWSHTGCEGPVIPDEEMPGKNVNMGGKIQSVCFVRLYSTSALLNVIFSVFWHTSCISPPSSTAWNSSSTEPCLLAFAFMIWECLSSLPEWKLPEDKRPYLLSTYQLSDSVTSVIASIPQTWEVLDI